MNHLNTIASSPEANVTVLIVDDDPANLDVLNSALQGHYRIRAARSGEQALRAMEAAPRPDLVLLDVMMPAMDGYEVMARLQQLPACRNIPVIFVTAMSEEKDERKGLALGAVDYLVKPISPAIVLARVRTHLDLKASRDKLVSQNSRLEALVAKRTQALKQAIDDAETAHAALKKSYFATLIAISKVVELRGAAIGGHSRRVANLSRQVANDMGMSESDSQDVFVAALLHDIGKIGFPDELLRKPVGAMRGEELALYRRHPVLGADALIKIDALANIATMVRHHHEHYDGTGFPDYLSGLDIPLGARIIAAASDYDELRSGAMTTARLSRKECHRHLIEGRGHYYDPTVIDHLEPLLSFDEGDEIDDIHVAVGHLQEGMLLTRDVMHPDGFLLLSKGTLLSRRLIDQLASTERNTGCDTEIYVLRERVET